MDHNQAQTGDDLRDFVNQKLFPYLHGFKQKASGPNTIENKIGEIFGEIKNRIHSGYNLREIIDHIDELHFRSQTEKHELSQLYEEKIKRMGNAGRNGGEYYTPRPLIRAMVQVVAPRFTAKSRATSSIQLTFTSASREQSVKLASFQKNWTARTSPRTPVVWSSIPASAITAPHYPSANGVAFHPTAPNQTKTT